MEPVLNQIRLKLYKKQKGAKFKKRLLFWIKVKFEMMKNISFQKKS